MGSSNKNHIDMESALEAMSHGVFVLTANRRLALELKGQYDRLQVKLGQKVWESANTESWTDWMQSQFQELIDLGLTYQTLLTQHQTHILWEQIILQSSKDQAILCASSVSRITREAWGLIQSWNINQKELADYANSETELFLSWAERFDKKCSQENWLDLLSVPNLVSEKLHEGALSAPDRIILAGFDEITPQQNELLDVLRERGCEISFLISERDVKSAHRFQAQDTTNELYSAARWAIKRIQKNPDTRIGIVVPKLAELRREVELILDRCLNPTAILPGSSHSEKAYNISLGIPLARCPLVVDAFLILRFASGELSSGDLSRLLRSPFLAGNAEESERRARLDAYIRSSVGEHEVSLDTLIRKLREISGREDDSSPILLNSLERFRKRLDHLPKRQSPQQWTEEFQGLLNIFGWCRSEGMGIIEFQQLEKFNNSFNSFQQLGQIQNSMGLQEALGRLHAILTETPFQAQGSDTQIQVVGILEAAGLKFDHLWVVGLNDECWPAPASPNPLLPISIQRKLDLPHASPRRELEYATAITERLLSSAGEVLVSHAATDGKGELRVSPLVAHLPQLQLNDLDIANIVDLDRVGFGSTKLEEMVDDLAPTLPTGTHLSGGSRLLADQSACPFRAFANHRLGATTIDDPVSGVDARIKGIMTHRILQQLWQQIGNQEKLLSMDAAELGQLVSDVVSQELLKIKPIRPETFVPRFIEIEQKRVTELIMEWLELELQRAPFTVVSLEQRERVSLVGLEMDVIADRIDRLENGTKLIVDYKTGKNLPYSGWFEQRMDEPQLPLYATTNSDEISGVFLAGVNRAKLGFRGVADQADVVPGVKAFTQTREASDYSGWDGLKAEWKQRLELLAKEILAGRADVMPKDPSKVCTYCSLPSLCRIHEWEEEA